MLHKFSKLDEFFILLVTITSDTFICIPFIDGITNIFVNAIELYKENPVASQYLYI